MEKCEMYKMVESETIEFIAARENVYLNINMIWYSI